MLMTGAYAQTHTVSGLVKDKEMGDPLVGVSVSVKGTKNATMTDLNGNYTIQTSPNDILVFKYVGMKDAEETVGNRKIINVLLVPNAESLGEVVVTAMGIKRQSETLTYSAQTVGGKDVNDIKSINMINFFRARALVCRLRLTLPVQAALQRFCSVATSQSRVATSRLSLSTVCRQ